MNLHLAALFGNLIRLCQECQPTDRQVRALEDVLLSSLKETTRQIDRHLEALELEEAVRIRCMRKG